jgi:hypothetical protein
MRSSIRRLSIGTRLDELQKRARQHRVQAALDNRLIHRVQRSPHRAEAVVDHLGFVIMDSFQYRALAAACPVSAWHSRIASFSATFAPMPR